MEKSLFERRNSGKPKINAELTEGARHRLESIATQIHHQPHRPTFNKIERKIGQGHLEETKLEIDLSPELPQNQRDYENVVSEIILNERTEIALTAVEILMNESFGKYKEDDYFELKTIREFSEEIKSILETEGILWEFTKEEGRYVFKEIGSSERAAKSDKEFRELIKGSEFESAFKSYNEAVRLFKERQYNDTIPKKLYNAVEETVKTICVDLEGWEDDREQNLNNYLQTMKEKRLFTPNEIMKPEFEEIAQGMFKIFHKSGNDRKNRHINIDRRYANLLIHQTAASLTYIVQNYKSKYQ